MQAKLGRNPVKADFEDVNTVIFITKSLGPWPRALEQAGLKEVSQSYLAKKARIRAKRIKKRSKQTK